MSVPQDNQEAPQKVLYSMSVPQNNQEAPQLIR